MQVQHSLGAQISEIAAGGKHTVAITSTNQPFCGAHSISRRLLACSVDGKALSFGCGKHGQVGHGDDENQLAPRLIEALEKKTIIAVGAGSIHSCFVTGPSALCLCYVVAVLRLGALVCVVQRRAICTCAASASTSTRAKSRFVLGLFLMELNC
jgi:hypothetical protein